MVVRDADDLDAELVDLVFFQFALNGFQDMGRVSGFDQEADADLAEQVEDRFFPQKALHEQEQDGGHDSNPVKADPNRDSDG